VLLLQWDESSPQELSLDFSRIKKRVDYQEAFILGISGKEIIYKRKQCQNEEGIQFRELLGEFIKSNQIL